MFEHHHGLSAECPPESHVLLSRSPTEVEGYMRKWGLVRGLHIFVMSLDGNGRPGSNLFLNKMVLIENSQRSKAWLATGSLSIFSLSLMVLFLFCFVCCCFSPMFLITKQDWWISKISYICGILIWLSNLGLLMILWLSQVICGVPEFYTTEHRKNLRKC